MMPTSCVFLLLAVLVAFSRNSFTAGMDKSLLYSPFNCGNTEWEVNFNDTEEAARHFNDWLLHWQFNCDKGHSINGKFAAGGGLGSSFMFGSKYFMDAIEMKQIFRPVHGNTFWTWAAESASNCTLNIRSYDCFSEPMSDCSVTNSNARSERLQRQLNESLERMPENPLRHIEETMTDICTFARVLKKSVKWVHGHLMYFMIRPRPDDVMPIINQHVQAIFDGLPKQTSSFVTIGMQIRSGTLDNNRKSLTNMTEILTIIDRKVNEVKELYNQTVSMVFLCGDIPEQTFHSGEYMNAHYPRSFTFRTSHLVSFGDKDVEDSLRNGYNPNEASRLDLFIDFISDIEILSTVDYLIGSNSNVYMVAAAMRAARRQHHNPENTCYIDRNETPDLSLLCEGTVAAHKLWSWYFSPHYTIFEPYPMHHHVIKHTTTGTNHSSRGRRKRKVL